MSAREPGEGHAAPPAWDIDTTTLRLQSPPSQPHVRIVIESDAADVPEVVLASVMSDAILAIHGRINITSAVLFVDGIEVPR